jgi:hypothetical protein
MAQDYYKKWDLDPRTDEIINAGDDFVVYLDEDLDLDWATSDDYDKKLSKKPKKHARLNNILNEAALSEAYPTEGLNRPQIRHFKRLVGEAMACGFEEDFENGEKMLAAANSYIQARSQEKSRYWYVTASALITLPFVLAGCGLVVWQMMQKCYATPSCPFESVRLLLISLVLGSIGALFSVISRSGNLPFTSSSGKRIHYLEAASRIGTGALAGAIVGYATQSQYILAPLVQGGNKEVIIILVAFAAGVSERMLTSIISTVDIRAPVVDKNKTVGDGKKA